MKSDGFVKTTLNCAEKGKDTFGPEVGIAHYDSDCTIKLGYLFAEKIEL